MKLFSLMYTNNIIRMDGLFYQYINLKKVKLWNTNQLINMSQMFQGCSSLTTLNLSSFNTNNVTNMDSMF